MNTSIARSRKTAGIIFLLIIMVCSSMMTELSINTANGQDRGQAENRTGRVDVLISFGEDDHHWTAVDLTVNTSAVNVTEAACGFFGYDLIATWNGTDASVISINGISNSSDWSRYWMMWLWNSTCDIWDATEKNGTNIPLDANDTIAWTFGNISSSAPEPTPWIRQPVDVEVLFDMGSGTYHWSQAVSDLEKMDGLNVTVRAADALGLEIEYTLGDYGAFVDSIGGLENAPDWSRYWMLYTWNGTSGGWESSQMGISSLTLESGDTIAWKYQSWEEPSPHATPEERHPLVVDILFYMGNGTVICADGVGSGGTTDALNLSADAAARAGLEFDFTLGQYGAFINSIGGVANDMDRGHYWMLYVWNASGQNWETSMVGASELMLKSGGSVAWIYGYYLDPLPAITPTSPSLDIQPPVLSKANVTYLGNSTYDFSVSAEYSGTGLHVFVVVDGTRHNLTAGARSATVYSARVSGISDNYTYYFGTDVRPSTESTAPLAGAPVARDFFNDSAQERMNIVEVTDIGPFLSRDSNPVPSATVTLAGDDILSVDTNDRGVAVFQSPIPAGSYTCTVSYNETTLITITNLTLTTDGTVTFNGESVPPKANKDLSDILGEGAVDDDEADDDGIDDDNTDDDTADDDDTDDDDTTNDDEDGEEDGDDPNSEFTVVGIMAVLVVLAIIIFFVVRRGGDGKVGETEDRAEEEEKNTKEQK